jgi:hypothetical protein
VEDDNIISSRGPQDIPLFINACLKRLESLWIIELFINKYNLKIHWFLYLKKIEFKK